LHGYAHLNAFLTTLLFASRLASIKALPYTVSANTKNALEQGHHDPVPKPKRAVVVLVPLI
jgi:hypothetical protein